MRITTAPDAVAFKHKLGITPTTYIIGSGPNGAAELDRIPWGKCCTIACNGAIVYDKPFTIWAAFDRDCLKREYWTHPNGDRRDLIRLFGGWLIDPRADYTFGITEFNSQIFPTHALRTNCTIAGAMVNLVALAQQC